MGPVGGGKSTIVSMLKRGPRALHPHRGRRRLRHHGLPDARGAAAPDPGRAARRGRAGVRHLHRGRPLPASAGTMLRDDYERPRRGRAGRARSSSPRRTACGIGTFSPSDPKSQDITELIGSHRPVHHRRVRRRERPTRLPLRRRAEHRQPRPDGIHRDAQVRREVPLRPADAVAGAEHQDRPLLDDLRRRGDRLAHQRDTSTTPSSATRSPRRSRTASSWSRCPTTCASRDEVGSTRSCSTRAPCRTSTSPRNTLRVASIFAVLSRLEESKKAGMSLMKKLKLYDGEEVEDFSQKDVRELQDEAVREGMDGISPRYVINRLSQRAGPGRRHLHQPDRRAARPARRPGAAHRHQPRGRASATQPDRRGAPRVRRAGQEGGPAGLRLLLRGVSAKTLLEQLPGQRRGVLQQAEAARPDHRGGGRAGRAADALDRGADRRHRERQEGLPRGDPDPHLLAGPARARRFDYTLATSGCARRSRRSSSPTCATWSRSPPPPRRRTPSSCAGSTRWSTG